MLPTNEIVARITGMNKKLLTDSREASAGRSTEESLGGMACPSPIDEIRGRREQPHEVRRRMYEQGLHTRGDRADFQYDLPKSVDSQDSKIPNHKMPERNGAKMQGADDLDDEHQAVGSKKTEAKRSMSKFYQEYIGSMEEFRHYAGLPMTEMTVPDPRVAHSGDVPTSGVGKQNKMKAGLPGLEGTPLQDIDPKGGPGDDDEVGDAKEMTLDQAIAMLKKEGVDTDAIWADFLSERGLTTELFAQLMDEAMQGEDAEEMDQLIAVENLFVQALPKFLPEGLRDLFGMKRKVAPDPLAPVRAAGDRMRQHGVAAVRAANARGVDVKASPAPVPTHPKHAETELGMATSVARPYRQDFSQGSRRARSFKPTRQMMPGESRQWEMECDDNGMGAPHMPWESKMGGLAGKYLSESKKTRKRSK